jgi:hypothetical protein
MNTTKHITVAFALAFSLATTALAQDGPTTPLGGQPPAPAGADCPESREAAAQAEALRVEARVLIGAANYADDQAKSIEKNARAARASLEAQQEAVRRSEARLNALKSGEIFATNPAGEIAKESATLAGYKNELDALQKTVDNEGALLATAIEYHRLADRKREEAAAKNAAADALVAAARARCGAADHGTKTTKEKKPKKVKTEKTEKREKSHALRNGFIGAGLVLGTHAALGGWHRRERCDGRHP